MVGIPCVNEAKNIERLLTRLTNITEPLINAIYVVSASSDETNSIVEQIQKAEPKIHLIKEPSREGKASAWNKIIRMAEFSGADVLIYLGGDNLPDENSFLHLLKPFNNPEIGIVGSKPVPINPSANAFCEWFAHELWNIHHIVNVKVAPKISGELMALRVGVVREMPPNIINDDFYLEQLFLVRGFKVAYAPNCVVYLKAPASIRDIIRQRRRIYLGHYQLKLLLGVKPSTARLSSMKYMFEAMPYKSIKSHAYLAFAIFIQLIAYVLSKSDLLRGQISNIWKMVESTKTLGLRDGGDTVRNE